MSVALAQAVSAARARLRPPPRTALSTWIEENVHLPDGLAARPGPVRLWPFQRGIADAISDPMIERVTVLKSVRVGYTMLLTGTIASFVANEPAPILVVQPTDDDCRDYVVSDMEPVFEASPAVAGALSADVDETGRNTIRHRRFPGGSLKIVAARSPRNLRRHTARILLIDEEDAIEVTQEGDAIDLAIKRTLSFPNRKIVRGSTPTDLDTSTICREYDASDRRVFEIRCVECDAAHEPLWDQIRWDPGRPDTASWLCPSCGTFVPERHKVAMVAAGAWRATRPEIADHSGFRLSALISPHANASWSKLAAEYLQVHDDPERLRTFHNTLLGRGWAESVEVASPEVLYERREPFGLNVQNEDGTELPFPASVLLLSAGVDVQDDRLECAFLGHEEFGPPAVLGHAIVHGRSDDPATWRELDEILLTRWRHPLGGTIGISAAAIDAGDGGSAEDVYEFAWARSSRGIMAVKGMAGFRPAIEPSKGKVSKGTLSGKGRLWIVGSDTVKAALLTRLAKATTGSGADANAIRFSASLPRVWFEQLCAERRVVRRIGGRPQRRFERIGHQAAEALDCVVYALAARASLPVVNFEARRAAVSGEPAVKTRPSFADLGARLNRKE